MRAREYEWLLKATLLSTCQLGPELRSPEPLISAFLPSLSRSPHLPCLFSCLHHHRQSWYLNPQAVWELTETWGGLVVLRAAGLMARAICFRCSGFKYLLLFTHRSNPSRLLKDFLRIGQGHPYLPQHFTTHSDTSFCVLCMWWGRGCWIGEASNFCFVLNCFVQKFCFFPRVCEALKWGLVITWSNLFGADSGMCQQHQITLS